LKKLVSLKLHISFNMTTLCPDFGWRQCHEGADMKPSDLSTLFEFFFMEEIPTTIIRTILSYIGPRSIREFTTSGYVYEYNRPSEQWSARGAKCGIKFLTNLLGGLEISYGDEIILVREILKRKKSRNFYIKA